MGHEGDRYQSLLKLFEYGQTNKKIGRTGDQRNNRVRPDHSTAEIGTDTEETCCDFREKPPIKTGMKNSHRVR